MRLGRATMILATLVLMGQASQPATRPGPGDMEQRCLDKIASWKGAIGGQMLDAMPGAADAAIATCKQADAAVAEYARTHQGEDKAIIQSAIKGKPCPKMPEELLMLIGNGRTLDEGPAFKRIEFYLWGIDETKWLITLTDGRISLQSERGIDGPFVIMSHKK